MDNKNQLLDQLMGSTHKIDHTRSSKNCVMLRPKTPPRKSTSFLLDLSVRGKTRWYTDCLSFDLSHNQYSLCNADGENGTIFNYEYPDKINYIRDGSLSPYESLHKTFDTVLKLKYYTWYGRDKYDEGLNKYFTISIDDEIIIVFDNTEIKIPRIWFNTEDGVPKKPDILEQESKKESYFTYSHMDLGDIIYETLCQIYLNKDKLDL